MSASSVKLYTLLFAAVNSALLAEEQEIDVSRSTNSQAVATVPNGYSGESPGAGMVEVDIKNAVPAGGFEFDAGKYMAALIPVDIQVWGPGGKKMSGKGFIISDTLRHGVNQEATYSFRVRMSLAMFA